MVQTTGTISTHDSSNDAFRPRKCRLGGVSVITIHTKRTTQTINSTLRLSSHRQAAERVIRRARSIYDKRSNYVRTIAASFVILLRCIDVDSRSGDAHATASNGLVGQPSHGKSASPHTIHIATLSFAHCRACSSSDSRATHVWVCTHTIPRLHRKKSRH